MNIPTESLDKWRDTSWNIYPLPDQSDDRLMWIAQRAAEWALSQPVSMEPVAWRWSESNGDRWFGWTTDWTHHERAKAMGFPIEYAYTATQLAAAAEQAPEAKQPVNQMLLEVLKELVDEFDWHDTKADKARAAIAEVKP